MCIFKLNSPTLQTNVNDGTNVYVTYLCSPVLTVVKLNNYFYFSFHRKNLGETLETFKTNQELFLPENE